MIRRTFASECIEAGVDVKSLSEILGHSSVNITLNRYVHSGMQIKKNEHEKVILSLNLNHILFFDNYAFSFIKPYFRRRVGRHSPVSARRKANAAYFHTVGQTASFKLLRKKSAVKIFKPF